MLAGCASDLFSETSAAAVYWAIINPLSKPLFEMRNEGNPVIEMFVGKPGNSPLGDTAHFAGRDGQKIGGEGDWLGVKVSAAYGLVFLRQIGKNDGIVVGGVNLNI